MQARRRRSRSRGQLVGGGYGEVGRGSMRVGDKRGCPSNRKHAPLMYGALFKLRSESAISHHKGNKPRGHHVTRIASAHCYNLLPCLARSLQVLIDPINRARCSWTTRVKSLVTHTRTRAQSISSAHDLSLPFEPLKSLATAGGPCLSVSVAVHARFPSMRRYSHGTGL